MNKENKKLLMQAPWDEVQLNDGYSEDVDLAGIYGEKAANAAKEILELLKM